MAYVFDGCFSRYVPGLPEAMRERWPQSRVRRIETPFDGVGLRMPWEICTKEEEELVKRFPDQLLEWSRRYPDHTFVCVAAECFGDCEYRGYVCKNGEKLLEEPFHPDSLARLMTGIGVKLRDGFYFEPFTRKFAWE